MIKIIYDRGKLKGEKKLTKEEILKLSEEAGVPADSIFSVYEVL